MTEKRRPDAEKLAAFLELNDFEEYMDRFEEFIGLVMGKETFRKEMELMGADEGLTHREKDKIREKRKRDLIRRLKDEIEELMDAIEEEGAYIEFREDPECTVLIRYRFPNDQRGDIDHAIAGEKAIGIASDGDYMNAVFSPAEHESIEQIVVAASNLFSGYDFNLAAREEGPAFLLEYNRIYQIEFRMWQVNYYRPEYRSMRSIRNQRLRELLKSYHSDLAKQRDRIYEKLIAEGKTHARWVSEQKAYAIVRSVYPDAMFQYRTEWLNGQRLDIYIPSLQAAIEYQGKQHTEPVEYFGGEEGLRSNQDRDRRKRYLCEENGVQLVYWNYDAPVTEEYFREKIQPELEEQDETIHSNTTK